MGRKLGCVEGFAVGWTVVGKLVGIEVGEVEGLSFGIEVGFA